jgi:hypothetical protein
MRSPSYDRPTDTSRCEPGTDRLRFNEIPGDAANANSGQNATTVIEGLITDAT